MKLLEFLPDRYHGTEIGLFQEAMQPIAEQLQEAVADFQAQLWPSTATWGLKYWERAFGLSVDVDKPVDFRRTRIIAKIRGGGATTPAALREVAAAFSNGEVEIIEYPAEHRFEVKFTGTIGTPPNIDDLTASINEIKPAHLSYVYDITFATWSYMKGTTWGNLSTRTWFEVKESGY